MIISGMWDFFKSLAEANQNELSDAEMDMVAGGKMSAVRIVTSIFTFGICFAAPEDMDDAELARRAILIGRI